ncbi:MAG TPA: endonuclease/exonuclease/phosphatase family protein [Sedimentisphaerales bacterium]|nr:endonuclease/exonuclease/phosphatase family protein [Sedimentisphaerales bacterium]
MRTFSIGLRVLLVILLVGVCAGGCSGEKIGSPTRVAVLTYNIYHGEDANGGSNLDAVAAIINSLEPDLVALQEVDNKTARAEGPMEGSGSKGDR